MMIHCTVPVEIRSVGHSASFCIGAPIQTRRYERPSMLMTCIIRRGLHAPCQFSAGDGLELQDRGSRGVRLDKKAKTEQMLE